MVRGTRLFKVGDTYSSWDEALAEAGKIYQYARSKLENKHCYKKRQYIGAPLMVGKENESILSRHAKPYFIRVVKEEGRFSAYILYLPSLYCEGLDRDKDDRPINHAVVNSMFNEVCMEFNDYISNHNKIKVII